MIDKKNYNNYEYLNIIKTFKELKDILRKDYKDCSTSQISNLELENENSTINNN